MRTTLDIASDVLHAAKERARRENKTTGEVISELARSALTAQPPASVAELSSIGRGTASGPNRPTRIALLQVCLATVGPAITRIE